MDWDDFFEISGEIAKGTGKLLGKAAKGTAKLTGEIIKGAANTLIEEHKSGRLAERISDIQHKSQLEKMDREIETIRSEIRDDNWDDYWED